jgi:hypothetical protein
MMGIPCFCTGVGLVNSALARLDFKVSGNNNSSNVCIAAGGLLPVTSTGMLSNLSNRNMYSFHEDTSGRLVLKRDGAVYLVSYIFRCFVGNYLKTLKQRFERTFRLNRQKKCISNHLE